MVRPLKNSQAQDKKEDGKEQSSQKWFNREDLQDLAKFGGDILKKTVVSGIDVLKEAKDTIPKEASQMIQKGKEEVLKNFSQDMAKNLMSYSMDKFFRVASQHSLEFSIRLRRHYDDHPQKSESTSKNSKPKK